MYSNLQNEVDNYINNLIEKGYTAEEVKSAIQLYLSEIRRKNKENQL